jgi:pectate lyase
MATILCVLGLLAALPLGTRAAPAQQTTACGVAYVVNQWQGGFVADIKLTNGGAALSSWTLTWSFSGDQRISNMWNASYTQSGKAVTATNASYNGSLPSGGVVQLGFQGTFSGSNDTPTNFALSGVPCNTSVTPTPVTPTPVTLTPDTPTPITPTPITPTPCVQPVTGLVGFATVNALGQNGTTGGAGGPVVTVTSASQLLDYISRTGPYVIQVQGTIALPGPMHVVASDKTIVGLGSDATITGGGFTLGYLGLAVDNTVTSPPANATKNVIIRNLTFRNYPDDGINVQMFSHHVWIDHNTFLPGFDGALDIKRGSDYVTVSWNNFEKTNKNSLVGHDDNNGAQDIGRLHVTYHHNWFNATTQRNPRVRFAELVHVYNNYYSDIGDYGVASAMNAGVLLEGNYFKNTEDTALAFKYGTGRLVARNNVLVASDPPETNGSVPEASSSYSYTQDNPNNIPSIVQASAGAGKLSSGASTAACTPTPVTPTPVTPTPVTPTPVTPTATPGDINFSLVGYGASTTGGAGGTTVTVSSLSALKSAAATSGALIIQVNGTITGGGSDEVEISSNKTVIGVGTSGKLVGVGLSISKSVSNVIIRNLSISKVVAPTDNIHIEGPNISNIWIDHNDLSSDTTHDKDYYDGALDITHGVDNVTVSWNVFHDHYKTSLIGHSDNNGSEDKGKLHVTYHHNYFRTVSSRGPSIRFGTLHAYNNLYENFIDASTGISSRMGACSRVENNVFVGVNQPVLTTQSGTGSDAGGVQLIGNDFGGGAVETSPTCSLTPPYSFSAQSTGTVAATVKAGAGVGKIQ